MREGLLVGFTLTLALLVALVGTQLLLPGIVADRVSGAITRLLPDHEAVTVRLQSSPALRMLGGRIDTVAIEVSEPVLAGSEVAWLAVRGRHLRIDVPSLLRRELVVEQADDLVLEIALDEGQLSRYVAAQLPDAASTRILLQQGHLRVQGKVTVLGYSIEASALGRLVPTGLTGVRFLPDEIEIEGERLPEFLYPYLDSLLRWELDLSALPLPVRIDSIAVTSEFVVIRGVWQTALTAA